MSVIKGAVNTTFVSNELFFASNATFGIINATFVAITKYLDLRIN